MAKEITMPKLSDTMTEGLFACWRKNVGDRVERGDIIAEVETDKAVMELEAFASGVLLKATAQNGELVPVGTVLGLIGEVGELDQSTESNSFGAPEVDAHTATVTTTHSTAPVVRKPISVHIDSAHVKASPMVRRMARDQGIDLRQVHGSGPEGRITQEDLASYTVQPIEKHDTKTDLLFPTATEPYQELPIDATNQQPVSTMRQAITVAVTQSWQTIPHFSVTMEIDMEACREVVNELKSGAQPVGYNALLIKACAVVLERFPLLRGTSATPHQPDIHISFAVALLDGLLMPVIRHCNNLTATEIEREATKLIEKCHKERLASEELSGGCFSVSNLGMFGVDEFTALIMPGQTAILAVGAIAERPVVRNGGVVAATTIRVTLSSDHRSVDGAYAARFLEDLRATLEKPVTLLI